MSARRSAVALRALGVAVLPASLLAALATGAGPSGRNQGEPPTPGWCRPGGTVTAAELRASPTRCAEDSVTVRDGQAAAVVPARGRTVAVDALTTSGEVHLVVRRDGTDRLAVLRAPAAAVSQRSACASSSYVRLRWHVRGTYTWWYNAAAEPAAVAGHALGAAKAATTDIVTGRNDCGLTKRPKVGAAFAGTTRAVPGVTAHAACGPDDSRSVTGWRSIAGRGYLALTCTYSESRSGAVVTSDTAVNTRSPWSVNPRTCRGAYDLHGALTHERGHTFGLDHTTAAAGLTMYPTLLPCDFSKSTLGRGDLLGLIAIYSAR